MKKIKSIGLRKPESEFKKRTLCRKQMLMPFALRIFAGLCIAIFLIAAACGGSESPYVTTISPPAGQVGLPYWYALAADGGTPPYNAEISGTLPPGLTFYDSGIGGTPTTAGVYNFMVKVTDSRGATGYRSMTIAVAGGVQPPTSLTFTPDSPLPDATVGQDYEFNFQSLTNPSGGHVEYVGGNRYGYTFFHGFGFPPMGLVLAPNGILSGRPAAEGTTEFEVCVKDLDGNQKCGITHITVVPPTSSSCPSGCVCMTEAEAQASPLWWEPCSSTQCSSGKYCWRQVAEPTDGTCPSGCVCMTEAEAQASPLQWEPCSSTQCSPGKYCWRQIEPPTEVDAQMTSCVCTNSENIAGGFTIWHSVVVKGTASGPVGAEVGGTVDSCSAWTSTGANTWVRGPNDPPTTEWQYKDPGGAIGGDSLTFYVDITYPSGGTTEWAHFPFYSSCPR